MKAAFLCTNPYLCTWFQESYPQVRIFSFVERDFLAYPVHFIHEMHEWEGNSYSLTNLWKKYLELDWSARKKKLILLGWKPEYFSNYLYVKEMPRDLETYIQKYARVIKEKPRYPQTGDTDILTPIGSALKSHKSANLQNLLNKARKELKPIELQIKSGEFNLISGGEPLENVRNIFQKIQSVWESKKGLFALMPQYPDLITLEPLLVKVMNLLNKGRATDENLYAEVQGYMADVITEITEKFNLDRHE
ncbi:MAG: hypothetical protein AAF696_20940 [Bacteroidota bacterium]